VRGVIDEPALLRMRRDAVVLGYSDDELARLARSGTWSRLRRGAYVEGDMPSDPVERHRLLVTATVSGLRRPAVVSHQSAAVLLDLPLWGVRLDRVHVTRTPPAAQDRSRVLHCHVARLRPDELVVVDGLTVTSPVRTLLDIARSVPFEVGVVALDGALHRSPALVDDLRAGIGGVVGVPGGRGAARAVAFADGRSESVGESRSRVLLSRHGVAPSDIQHRVLDDGLEIARTDFVWEEDGLVGEFDGLIKYGRLLRPGQKPQDVVIEEKLRENAIRDTGWGVLRWIWNDLQQPVLLAGRVRRARERSSRRRR
jgi:hypothetical protein